MAPLPQTLRSCALLLSLLSAALLPLHARAIPGGELQAAITAAVARGDASFDVSPGSYDFDAASLVIANASKFTINGAGSTLTFAPGFGVLIVDSRDVVVSSLVVAYSPTCFTQGTVVAMNATAIDVAVEPTWPSPNSSYFDSGEIKLQFWDATTRRRLPSQSGSCIVHVVGQVPKLLQEAAAVASAVSDAGTWRLAPKSGFSCALAAPPPPGTPLLATISPRLNASAYEVPDFYRGQAWWIHASANVTTADVTLLGSGNFAFTESLGDGGHTYRRVELARAPGALLSSNTDGFHSFSVGTGPTIVDSLLSFPGDDVINIHNRVGVVLDVDAAAGAVRVVDVGDVPSPDGGAIAPARALSELRPGDSLRFASPADVPRGAASVVALKSWVTDDPAALAAARALAAALPGVTVNPAAVGLWLFVFTTGGGALPPDVARGDFVNYDARSGFGARVENCTFEDAYDGVMRLSAGGAILRGNSWARTRAGLSLTFDPSWLEGATSFDGIVIENNIFSAVGWPPATTIDGVVHVGTGAANVTIAGNSVSPAAE